MIFRPPHAPAQLPRRRALLLAAAGWAALLQTTRAQPVAKENELKAACLAKFAQYIEWPASAFASPAAPIVIGVVGEDLFGPDFANSLKGFKVGARPLTVRHCAGNVDCSGCHVLYLNVAEPARLKAELTHFNQRPCFTAADHPDFLKLGGMLRFWRDGEKIAFQINVPALRAVGLSADPRLLKLSRAPGDK
jgi:hypothetical protein